MSEFGDINPSISELDMTSVECQRLDMIRSSAHILFLEFQKGEAKKAMDCIITLREAYRLLEFSLSDREKKELDEEFRILKTMAVVYMKKSNRGETFYRADITERIDKLFSQFYFHRQRAGLGVKMIEEEADI